MSYIRPATHGGTWYSNNPSKLASQLENCFQKAKQLKTSLSDENIQEAIKGARILVGPHAGYAYSGERLAETFNVWDNTNVRRIFLLGPSHHVYFRNHALLSRYKYYETPFGNLPVDTETTEQLIKLKSKSGSKSSIFKYMSEEIDEDEHSFEMHTPFIYYRSKDLPQGLPSIIPILISGMDDRLADDLVESLLPFLKNEENHFIVSSDFCHWGSRFGYTEYLPNEPSNSDFKENDLVTLHSSSKIKSNELPIYKSIEFLDKAAMQVASSGSYGHWKQYISITGNTICGQRPIGIVLKLLQEFKKDSGHLSDDAMFRWIGYSQSNHVFKYYDSSVSYASGYVKL